MGRIKLKQIIKYIIRKTIFSYTTKTMDIKKFNHIGPIKLDNKNLCIIL